MDTPIKLMHVVTKEGNFFVFQVNMETGLPTTGKPGFYATPEGAFLRKKNNAKSELKWAKENWGEHYEEKEIPHEIHQSFAQLFTDKPLERSFGKVEKESPFAGLAALKAKMEEQG